MKKLNTDNWEKFQIDSLFTAENTGNVLARDVEDGSGETPYVTASGVNNVVAGHIDAKDYKKFIKIVYLLVEKHLQLPIRQKILFRMTAIILC